MSLNILVAEDNQYTMKQYQRVLENNGHKVMVAHDGQECIQKFVQENKKKNLFDVVLLDNNMPKKNGIDAAKEILDENPTQRIIFASAYDIDSLLNVSEKIKKSVEILSKPFSLSTLISKIQKNK